MNHFFRLLTCCVLFWSGLHAQTAKKQNILFILDASGSMAGKIDKATKIQVAKETIGKLADKITPDANVGLIVYGHRSAADCNDIQTLIPIGSFDKPKFVAAVKGLTIKGKTPIANSINQALALIRGIADPVTIILLTDGLETCEGNACEAINGAKAAGIKITMHVVGFGIADKDLSPLECIAQAGGGQYFPANNASELAAALEQTVEEVPVGNAYFSVRTTLEGKLKDATVKVFKKGGKNPVASGRTYERKETNPRVLPLAAGTYEIEIIPLGIESYPAIKLPGIVINANDTTFKEIEFEQGEVQILVTRNNDLSDATIQVFTAGTNKPVAATRSYKGAATNPAKIKIPPGVYDIVISSVEISGSPKMKIINKAVGGSGNLQFSHNFESGELSIGARKGSEYVDVTVNIVDTKTGKSVGAGRTYQSPENNPKKFTLEPGTYRVDLGPVKPAGLARKSTTVEIKAGTSVEKLVEW